MKIPWYVVALISSFIMMLYFGSFISPPNITLSTFFGVVGLGFGTYGIYKTSNNIRKLDQLQEMLDNPTIDYNLARKLAHQADAEEIIPNLNELEKLTKEIERRE